jgi:hypothetical protein
MNFTIDTGHYWRTCIHEIIDAPRDIIDFYLGEMEEQSKKDSSSTFGSISFSLLFNLI